MLTLGDFYDIGVILRLYRERVARGAIGHVALLLLPVLAAGCSTSYGYRPGSLPDSQDTGQVVSVGDQVRVATIAGEVHEGAVAALSDSLTLITDRVEPRHGQVRLSLAEIEKLEIGVAGQTAGEKNVAVVVLATVVGVAAFVVVFGLLGVGN